MIKLDNTFLRNIELQAENQKLKAFIKWGEREEVYETWLKQEALKDSEKKP